MDISTNEGQVLWRFPQITGSVIDEIGKCFIKFIQMTVRA